jgi:hypothetical protein
MDISAPWLDIDPSELAKNVPVVTHEVYVVFFEKDIKMLIDIPVDSDTEGNIERAKKLALESIKSCLPLPLRDVELVQPLRAVPLKNLPQNGFKGSLGPGAIELND